MILITWHPNLIFGFIILACIATKYFTTISKNEYDVLTNRTKYERKSWYIAHLLIKDEYIKEIKLFNLSNYLLEQFSKLRDKFFDENVILLKKQFNFSQLYQISNYIVTFIIVCLAIYESSMGLVLVGTTMTYINTTSKIESAIQNLVSSFFIIYKDSLYVENIEKFFNYKPLNNQGKISIDEINTIENKIKKLKALNETYLKHEKLFENEQNPSGFLQNLVDEFAPLHLLWNLANEWFNANTTWLDTPFAQVKADTMNQFMIQATKNSQN